MGEVRREPILHKQTSPVFLDRPVRFLGRVGQGQLELELLPVFAHHVDEHPAPAFLLAGFGGEPLGVRRGEARSNPARARLRQPRERLAGSAFTEPSLFARTRTTESHHIGLRSCQKPPLFPQRADG